MSPQITESVTIITKIDESDTKPFRMKLKNPDFRTLFTLIQNMIDFLDERSEF